MTSAISAFGSQLQKGDGATPTENFTTIAEVADLSGPSLEQAAINATSHDSAYGYDESIGGILSGGEVSFDLNFNPVGATHVGLITDMNNHTLRNFRLILPDVGTTTWAFAALVTAFETTEPIDDKLAASVTLKISGKPVLS